MRFVSQETVTVNVTRELTPPLWIVLAMKGERIPAIKALRELGGMSPSGLYMGLDQARKVVDNIMSATRRID